MLTTDDYYALLRIIEILPVCDPFLTTLQTKLSEDERERWGDQASHLSGSEFVREIDRVEALILGAFRFEGKAGAEDRE